MAGAVRAVYPPGMAPTGAAGAARQRSLRALLYAGLLAASVIGHLWYAQTARIEEPILVVARAVPAGRPLTAADIARESGRLPAASRQQAIPASSLPEMLGRPVSHDLQPGDPLLQSSLISHPQPRPGQVAVTVALKADFTATTLTPGERVDVIALDNKGEALAREVVIQSLAATPGGSGYLSSTHAPSVTLLVQREEASRIVAAAARAGIALAQLPPAATTAPAERPEP